MESPLCRPCYIPIFSVYFSNYRKGDLGDAESMWFDFRDLKDYMGIISSCPYDVPGDFPECLPTEEERIQEILKSMRPHYQQMGLSIEEYEFIFPFDSPFSVWCPDDNTLKYHPDPRILTDK